MIKLGHIEIKDDKVIFVYHEIWKPYRADYYEYSDYEKGEVYFNTKSYNRDLKEYEASKREVEVENIIWGELCKCWIFNCENPLDELEGGIEAVHNQPCEAEVTNGKATIIKIL